VNAQPPAYDYPPPAPPAYFTAQRLAMLDAQLYDLRLRHDEITFGGPTALIVGGIVVGIAGIAIIGANDCSYDYYGSQSYYDYEACRREHEDETALGALMLIGGAIAVPIGIIQSIIRGSKRSHLRRQISLREAEANALRGLHPRWGLAPTRGGGSMSLALDF
jgi:hypothetical protein